MNKFLLTGIAGLTLGIVVGVGITIIAYPFLFPPPVLNEKIADVENKEITFSGSFIHPNPSDPVHWGKGDISIYQQAFARELFFGSNFEVAPGPAYHVYLSTGEDIKSSDDFNSAEKIGLGSLKSFTGSQIYKITNDIDSSDFRSVVIWCEAFRVLISSANLMPIN